MVLEGRVYASRVSRVQNVLHLEQSNLQEMFGEEGEAVTRQSDKIKEDADYYEAMAETNIPKSLSETHPTLWEAIGDKGRESVEQGLTFGGVIPLIQSCTVDRAEFDALKETHVAVCNESTDRAVNIEELKKKHEEELEDLKVLMKANETIADVRGYNEAMSRVREAIEKLRSNEVSDFDTIDAEELLKELGIK